MPASTGFGRLNTEDELRAALPLNGGRTATPLRRMTLVPFISPTATD